MAHWLLARARGDGQEAKAKVWMAACTLVYAGSEKLSEPRKGTMPKARCGGAIPLSARVCRRGPGLRKSSEIWEAGPGSLWDKKRKLLLV
jgi:hypothetical protein